MVVSFRFRRRDRVRRDTKVVLLNLILNKPLLPSGLPATKASLGGLVFLG